MRQVPLATVKDKLSEYAAAAAGGDEIVVTRHGRPYVRLVALIDDEAVRRQQRTDAALRLRAVGDEVLKRHGPIGVDEIVGWINEDRR